MWSQETPSPAVLTHSVAQADVLELHALPPSWNNYDLIVSASMLEYSPRAQLPTGLRGLRPLLGQGGSFVLFITRRNWLTRPFIGRWREIEGMHGPWGEAPAHQRFTQCERHDPGPAPRIENAKIGTQER